MYDNCDFAYRNRRFCAGGDNGEEREKKENSLDAGGLGFYNESALM